MQRFYSSLKTIFSLLKSVASGGFGDGGKKNYNLNIFELPKSFENEILQNFNEKHKIGLTFILVLVGSLIGLPMFHFVQFLESGTVFVRRGGGFDFVSANCFGLEHFLNGRRQFRRWQRQFGRMRSGYIFRDKSIEIIPTGKKRIALPQIVGTRLFFRTISRIRVFRIRIPIVKRRDSKPCI